MEKTVSLGDSRYFDLFIGKRKLKKELLKSEGEIPVYSANVQKPFGFVQDSNAPDFDHDYVLWAIDGEFGFNIKKKGERFATTDHCGAIRILDDGVVPEYLLHQLELIRKQLGFDRSLRSSLANMKAVTVNIPSKTNGGFDIDAQMGIANEVTKLKGIQAQLNIVAASLREVNLIISDIEIGKHIQVSLGNGKLFAVSNGERITKKDIDQAKGEIPVYSSSKFRDDALGYVSHRIREIVKDAMFFDGVNLTVNADGSVGSVFVRNQPFYANDVCNVVKVQDAAIEPTFLSHELRTQISEMGLSWTNKLYKQKLRAIQVRIPVQENGAFDSDRQRAISNRLDSGYEAKESILAQLEELGKSVIALGGE